jgi:hypothetical protein
MTASGRQLTGGNVNIGLANGSTFTSTDFVALTQPLEVITVNLTV